jgi:hypothetical protein
MSSHLNGYIEVVKSLKGKRSMITVADLNAAGCKVKVKHVRPIVPGPIMEVKITDPDLLKDRREQSLRYRYYFPPVFAAMGGRTEVSVLLPNGEVLLGSAECSDKDHYNRKMGGRKAIARALAPVFREVKLQLKDSPYDAGYDFKCMEVA